ncbi:hypothetical protein ES319_D07G026400v1 [Gossypium barbadense]|uniref:Uncharacterized protein n=1 Tax=Gossypium barbadense TaxID=3634 RepID=A0A5J5QLT1_GOSBA|nr:hypothetical protein ES319_D07G026400v1 [Gossypium barbadense]
MVHLEVNSPSYDGSKWNRLVILPLPKAGDNRCSVKPASRSTLHSKNHENRSFRSIPSAQLSVWYGQVRCRPQWI